MVSEEALEVDGDHDAHTSGATKVKVDLDKSSIINMHSAIHLHNYMAKYTIIIGVTALATLVISIYGLIYFGILKANGTMYIPHILVGAAINTCCIAFQFSFCFKWYFDWCAILHIWLPSYFLTKTNFNVMNKQIIYQLHNLESGSIVLSRNDNIILSPETRVFAGTYTSQIRILACETHVKR